MKNKLKDSKGVVSVFAMLAMLFFLLFIIGAYIGVSRLNKMQKESDKELLKLYSSNVDPQAVYNEMIADVDEVIPVYEYEDLPTRLFKFKAINGKVYFLTPQSAYELKTDIIVPPNIAAYENVFLGDYQYSCIDSMKVLLDGDNNSGTGHNPDLQTSHNTTRYAIWKNLVNLDDECNIYAGGTIRAYTTETEWGNQSLVFNGAGTYVRADNILDENAAQETIEVVFKTSNNTKKQYIFSNGSVSVGITPKTQYGHAHGVFFVEYEDEGVVVTQETSTIAYNNKIYSVAISYNGTDMKLYINGQNAIDAQNFETQPVEFATIPYKYKSGKFAVGIHAYIGTASDVNSTAGVTISPYFVEGYPIGPSYRMRSNGTYESKITNVTAGTYHWAKDLFLSFGDLNKVNVYTLLYGLKYNWGGVVQNQDFTYSNLTFGSRFVEGSSLDIISRASDSVIIRSNVGKIQNWKYSEGATGYYTDITPSEEVLTLGNWYYSFDNLKSNTSAGVRYAFKGDYSMDSNNLLNLDSASLFIGKRYNNSENDTLVGEVYAARAYDIALTEDNIQTNFIIDKTKYGIN